MNMNWEGGNIIFFRQLKHLYTTYKRKIPKSFKELMPDLANFKGENQYAEVYCFHIDYQ